MKRAGFKKKTYSEVITKKKTTKKVVKKVGTRSLRKKLWTLFSLFIRERDKYKCFTCDKIATGSGMHAGHFITGATCSPELYFCEENVHAQCYNCNINLSGNWVKYETKMIEKYGDKFVKELKLRRTLEMGQKKDESWYKDKIDHYKS